MKRILIISGALAALALTGAWFASAHSEKKNADGDTVTLEGIIEPKTFFDLKDRLVNSTATHKTVLVNSGGGNWESALALGILIHRHGWNVEVVDLCASSCANFIFPAGKTKYLHRDSMLMFHGGPHQENLVAQATAVNQPPATNAAPPEAQEPDRSNMEGHALVDDKGPLRLKVWEFLGVKPTPKAEDLVSQLISVSDQFYEELGVNLQLPTYGQTGRYEATYKSYKYFGYIYRLDSLRRLGVSNIKVKGGKWRPERHRDYPSFYEVTYP